MRARVVAVAAVALFLIAAWATPASAQYVGGRPPGIQPPAGPGGQGPGGEGPGGLVRPTVRLVGPQLTPVNVLISGVELAPPSVRVVPVIEAGAATRGGGFAVTGADVAQLALLAGSLIVVGAVLTRSARRRPAGSEAAVH
jgi:hypothetical protein